MYECVQVLLETFEIAGMLINFHSGKFRYSYVIFLAEVMPKFLVNFDMTLAENVVMFCILIRLPMNKMVWHYICDSEVV